MNRVTTFVLMLLIGFSAPIEILAQSYNPNIQIDSTGGSFGGLRFQGVSGAVLNCTNLTQKAAVAIGGFTKKISGGIFGDSNDDSDAGYNYGNDVDGDGYDDASGAYFGGSALVTNSVSTADKNTRDEVEKNKEEVEKINKTNLCLNAIAYGVAKNLLADVINKTLVWATGGGIYGLPLFLNNPNLYVKNLTNEQINKYLQSQNNHPIFNTSIQTLIMLGRTGVNDGRLSSILNNNKASVNYRSFQQDFTNGGWGAFMNMNYNPVGALFSAGDNLARNISSAQQDLAAERAAGNGFLDVKTCKKWSADRSVSTLFSITPEPTCLEWETVTPGYVVAGQVSQATQSVVRQLELADSYNEVLGAYFDSLLSGLFQKGIKGITTGGTVQTKYGDETYLGDIFGDGTRGTFGYVSAGRNGYAGEFDISKPQHTRTILQTQVDYLNSAKDSFVAMRHIVPVLGALDYCIPGPNPTWKTGTSENYQSIIGSLTNKLDKSKIVETRETLVDLFGPIGKLADFISKLFGNGSDYTYYYFSQPTLYDKVSDNYTDDVTLLSFKYVRSSQSQPSDEEVVGSLDNGYSALLAYLKTLYTGENITRAFLNASQINTNYDYTVPIDFTPYLDDETPGFSVGRIADMLDVTSKLVGYNQSVSELVPEYIESIGTTEDVVEELTAINTEVQQIVSKAKARYIAENKTAGTPIKESCINNQYVINNRPVVGIERQESDEPDQMLLQSIRSNKYFYDNL